MTEVDVVIHSDGLESPTRSHPTLAEAFDGVVIDLLLNDGFLNLTSFKGLSYQVAMITLPDGDTHTYLTGPKIVTLLVRLAQAITNGTDPRTAMIGLPGDLYARLTEPELIRLRTRKWAPLTRFIARWVIGQTDEAISLLMSPDDLR